MAKRLTEEDIKLNIMVNGNAAQKEIFELEAQNRKLKESQAEINKKLKETEAETRKATSAYQKNASAIKEIESKKKSVLSSLDKEKTKLEKLAATTKDWYLTNKNAYSDQAKIVRELEREQKKLEAQSSKLAATEKTLSNRMDEANAKRKSAKAEYDKLGSSIAQNNARIQELTSGMKVSEMTMTQLTARAKVLKMALAQMVDGADRQKLARELGEVNLRMQQLNQQAQIQKLSWSSAANWLNKYQSMLIGFTATLTGVVFTFQQWLDYSGKLADQQANVRKTTGMTKDEVDALTEAFGRLQTRTSRMELLEIAEEGGRIGIAKDQMKDFLEVMNMANVALGDTFTGGVSEVASVLGKLKFLFEETKDLGVDVAYHSIGSAINELGANGAATENNIAEFATRVGALPAQLKPSVAEALALGASFEESGIKAEVGARAYGIVLRAATEKTEKFAKVMKLSVGEVEEMINRDPTKFFLDFTETLKDVNPEGVEMARMLHELSINAEGANKIVGAAANNNKRFRENIALSNKSMAEATSLTDEYNIKNENLAATMAKINKTVMGWFTSKDLMEWLGGVMESFAKLIGATEDATGSAEKWRHRLLDAAKIIVILTSAIVSYNLAVKLNALWTARATAGSALWNLQLKMQNILAGINIIKTQLMAAAQALFAGKVRTAVMELRALNAVMAVSPWGLIAMAIGAVTAALMLYNKELTQAEKSQKILNEARIEAEKSIVQEINNIEQLVKVAKYENLEKEKRIEALNELKKIMPEYADLLTLEKINTLEAASAIKKYTDDLRKNARMKALQAKFDAVETQKLDMEGSTIYDTGSFKNKADMQVLKFIGLDFTESKTIEDISNVVRNKFKNKTEKEIQDLAFGYAQIIGLSARQKAYSELEDLQADLEEEMMSMIQDSTTISGFFGDEESGTFGDLSDPKKDKSKADKAKSEREKRIQELIKENEAMAKELEAIRHANEDAMLSIREDSFQKELHLLEIQHKRKMADLRAEMVDEATIRKIEQERAASGGDQEKLRLLDNLLAQIKEKNIELNNSLVQEELNYQYGIGAIHATYAMKRLDELKKEYDQQKEERDRAYQSELYDLGTMEAVKERLRGEITNRELANIRTWEDAKKALREYYNKQELDQEIAFTEQLLKEMQTAWEQGSFGAFDLEFMTEEERKAFEDQIEQLKAKLIELGVIKAELAGKSPDFETYGMGGNVDILGMTPDNWDKLIENIQNGVFELSEMVAVVNLMQNAMRTFFNFTSAGYQRDAARFEASTNKKRNDLKKQLDEGLISQQYYDEKMRHLEAATEKRKKVMEYKQKMAEWRQSLAEAAIGTAVSIAKVSHKPWQVALVAALGALQMATIAKNKPIKGFEEGFYQSSTFDVIREQDGTTHRATFGGQTKSGLVKTPTVFLAGEHNKPEMIIDNKSYRQLSPELKYTLTSELARVHGYEDGLYPSNGTTTLGDSEIKQLLAQNNVLMEQNNALLTILAGKDNQAYLVMDYEQMRTFKKVESDYQNHLNKNKR